MFELPQDRKQLAKARRRALRDKRHRSADNENCAAEEQHDNTSHININFRLQKPDSAAGPRCVHTANYSYV
jgi:hypothetical protein